MVGCRIFFSAFYVHLFGRLLSCSVQVRLEAARLKADSRHPVLIGPGGMHHPTQTPYRFVGGHIPEYLGQVKISRGILAGCPAVDSVSRRPLVRPVGGGASARAAARVRYYIAAAAEGIVGRYEYGEAVR